MASRNGRRIAKTPISRGFADWKIPPVHEVIISFFMIINQMCMCIEELRSIDEWKIRKIPICFSFCYTAARLD
jgi:hypothetical protein